MVSRKRKNKKPRPMDYVYLLRRITDGTEEFKMIQIEVRSDFTDLEVQEAGTKMLQLAGLTDYDIVFYSPTEEGLYYRAIKGISLEEI